MLLQQIKIGNRLCHIVSDDREAEYVLIKPLGEFERLLLEDECKMISQRADKPYVMFAFEVNEQDLSEEDVERTYDYLMTELLPEVRRRYPSLPYILGGYSLGGLFALWTSTKTDAFRGIASCSPSLWVDGWNEYADANPTKAKAVYLSLGDKEANTKKGKFACINERVNLQHQRHQQLLGEENSKLEINEGGHFADIEVRKSKGFAWCLSRVGLLLFITAFLLLGIAAPLTSCEASEEHTELQDGNTIRKIKNRGVLLVGTTGDYRPLTYKENDGTYWGFGIEIAGEIAKRLDVDIQFVPTSWPTLTADVMAEIQTFDLAIGGITITDQRKEIMIMSEGYLANGKTILCRAADADKFRSIADIDRPEVKVMINPGGTNEKFAYEHFSHAEIIVHQRNEEIPELIAIGKADIMVTEITEAPYYVKADSRLAAPLVDTPFTRGSIGVLMRKGQDDLLELVNNVIKQMKADGSLRKLHEKYGLVYAFDN